jgi:hypothetical protein
MLGSTCLAVELASEVTALQMIPLVVSCCDYLKAVISHFKALTLIALNVTVESSV